MFCIFNILRFRFLRVATKERFLKVCCSGHKDWFSWPENSFIVYKRQVLAKKSVVRFNQG
jgi:hypothetical protein